MQQQSLQVRNVVSEIVGMDALQDVHLSAFLLCPADRQPCGNALERENPSNMSIHLVYLKIFKQVLLIEFRAFKVLSYFEVQHR